MIERVHLAHLPTPIEDLPRLTKLLGGPNLIIKRDDLTGLGLGGNKTRKLEYLAARALAEGADTLLSTGAVQSNHCRQVAAAAARLGLGCTLVLAGSEPQQPQGNLLLDKLSGAQVIFVEKNQRDHALQAAFDALTAAGKRPSLIPYGGSNAFGALGYWQAMHELKAQGARPDWIVFATSSGGTQAGMLLGAADTGFTGRILGISIEHTAAKFKPVIASLVKDGADLLGGNRELSLGEILVDDQYCAAGYGVLTDREVEAVNLFARQEGILLDPVYTGRAAAGLVDLARKGFFKPTEQVLFWHTGGTPALFAEPYTSGLLQ